ncbi:MAG TPA: HicB family toxin-antitoxin system [Actinomycetes bacterium]|nr:HicB family toxin-antitoxin system [Actinomycetes bacterium]
MVELVSDTYAVNAEREGRWWVITVPALNKATQAPRFSDVEGRAKELIATWLDCEVDQVHVDVMLELPETVREHQQAAEEARREEAEARARAARESRAAVRELADAGMTVRDIGAVLGISYQRAQQLLRSA